MQDLIEQVRKQQEKSLEKYKYKNNRYRNIEYHFVKEDKGFEDIKEIKTEQIKTEQKVIEKPKAEESSMTLEDFKAWFNKNKQQKTSTQTNKTVQNNNTVRQGNDIDKFANFINSAYKNKQEELKKTKNSSKETNLSKDNRNKVIADTYTYILETLYNYSLIYEEFDSLAAKFDQMYIPELKQNVVKPNSSDYIYKLRTVSLIQKINLIAYQIGKYNFSMISENVKSSEIFRDYTPEDLSIGIVRSYKGSDIDFDALYKFYEIARDDLENKIVIKNTVEQKKEQEKKERTFEVRKEKRKTVLNLGGFNLKKK